MTNHVLSWTYLKYILNLGPVPRPYGELEVSSHNDGFEAIVTLIEPNHYKRFSIFSKTLPALLSMLIEANA